jgi:6-pyruvoyl tetrahydropterin synthase/QueD family protein
MSYQLEKRFTFEAAHRLPHHKGKCSRLHGHSWVGWLIVKGDQLQSEGSQSGMLVDYSDLGALIKPICEEYLDHHFLNETLGLESPTSEAIAKWIFDRLKYQIPFQLSVAIEETCTSRCVYSEPRFGERAWRPERPENLSTDVKLDDAANEVELPVQKTERVKFKHPLFRSDERSLEPIPEGFYEQTFRLPTGEERTMVFFQTIYAASMSDKTYRINEIFFSLQGEGARAGSANVFIRFSGCNLKCDIEESELSPGGFPCDTEFVSGRQMTASEIVKEAQRVGGECDAVICTGGEPLLQLDDGLIAALQDEGYFIAIETNGTRIIPDGINWVTVSPKVAEHALKAQRADELKYVLPVGKSIPRPSLEATHYYISPAWSAEGLDQETLSHCVQLCLDNPKWQLSLQVHKIIGLR